MCMSVLQAPVSEVAPNVSGDVANYVLRVAEVVQSTEVLDASEVCGVSGCSYRVNNTFAGDSGQYTVILQARNIVGTGLQGQCGTIGKLVLYSHAFRKGWSQGFSLLVAMLSYYVMYNNIMLSLCSNICTCTGIVTIL